MESVKLNYLHLCDAANIDSNGKLSMLGIFSRIFLPSVPNKFRKFTIVCSLTINSLSKEKESIQLKFLDSKNKELNLNKPIKFDINIKKDNLKKDAVVNLLLDISNLEFSTFGKHSLNVLLNEKKIGETSLVVEERKRN